MENNNITLDSFLDGYINVHKQLEELGGIDKASRMEQLRKEIDKAEEEISKITGKDGKQISQKEFEEKSKPFMEKIRDNEKEIIEYEKQQKELMADPEKLNKVAELKQAKENIRKNAKEFVLNASIEKGKEIQPKEEELDRLKEEYANIQKAELADPKRPTDSKYKEYLTQKIDKLEQECENFYKKDLTPLKRQYTEFMKNCGRVDRGEPIQKSLTPEQQAEIEKQRQERKEYNRAWDEAIKENERRDREAAREDEAHIDMQDVLDPSMRVPGDESTELPKDLKITIGRSGILEYKSDLGINESIRKFKIPKKVIEKALKEEMSLDDMKEMFTEAGLKVKDDELLTKMFNSNNLDTVVLRSICSVRGIGLQTKVNILNEYMRDCLKAENNLAENKCNIVYDKDDLSKSIRLDKAQIEKFIENADKAKDLGVATTHGEYEPRGFAKFWKGTVGRLTSFVTGKLAIGPSQEDEEQEPPVSRDDERQRFMDDIAAREDVEDEQEHENEPEPEQTPEQPEQTTDDEGR